MSTTPQKLDKYELRELLGRGGMAEVWKALDVQLQRYVAIKILHTDLQNDPTFLTRFEREAQVIASLHHPNIVKIHDFRIARPPEHVTTLPYMVMDYVEGQTLARYLRSMTQTGKYMTPATIVSTFTPICMAVDYAHRKHVVHRDLKPANILLDQRDTSHNPIGEPILSDFGIVKILGSTNSTLSGWWLGTPSYTSPEQIQGAPGNEQSDIYALAIILYEMAAGVLPFQGDTPTSVVMQHLHNTPPPPHVINPTIPPALSAVVARGLSKVPNQRYSSAATMAVAVAQAFNMPVADNVLQASQQAEEVNHATHIARVPYTPPGGNPTPTNPISQSGYILTNNSGPGAFPSHSSHPSQALSGGVVPNSNPTPGPVSMPSLHAVPAPVTPFPEAHITPTLPRAAEPVAEKRRRRRIIGSMLLAILLILATMAALIIFAYKPPAPPPPVTPVVGHVFFTSSGLLNPDNSQGINDQVVIDLHGITAPQPGKALYAWLLGDKSQSEAPSVYLGQLTPNNGNASLLYKGNTLHSNLLLYESRFLITEEDAAAPPTSYSPDTRTWRYYAEISQAPSPKDKLHFTLLDHLRHLTSESPELKARGLRGGLDMWFLRNTQKILEWANAARDEWRNNTTFLHSQTVRILDYMDGASNVQQDAPAVGPTLLVNAHDAQVALLGKPFAPDDPPGYTFDGEVPPGYVYLVSSHLAGAVLSPDATPEQRALAGKIHNALDQVRLELTQIQQDAKQLLVMTPAQLNQPSTLSLLDDLVTQCQYAYSGQTDPLSGLAQGGAIWITSNIQRIANFTVKPYTSTNH